MPPSCCYAPCEQAAATIKDAGILTVIMVPMSLAHWFYLDVIQLKTLFRFNIVVYISFAFIIVM